MYRAMCNLSSTDKFTTLFLDPGLTEGGMQNLSDDDQLKAWMAMTAHLDCPLGIGVYLWWQLASGIPDSPTQRLMPHLNLQVLVYDAHPEVEKYPYDSEAYEVISKSHKRVGKPRTIEGYICSLCDTGCCLVTGVYGESKGNQATFDNSQRNNLRSCVWVR